MMDSWTEKCWVAELEDAREENAALKARIEKLEAAILELDLTFGMPAVYGCPVCKAERPTPKPIDIGEFEQQLIQHKSGCIYAALWENKIASIPREE